jgi:WD40 repeat protein
VLKKFEGHKNDIISIIKVKDDFLSYSSSEIILRDVNSGIIKHTVIASFFISKLTLLNEELFATAEKNNKITFWDLKTFKFTKIFKPNKSVQLVHPLEDGSVLAATNKRVELFC